MQNAAYSQMEQPFEQKRAPKLILRIPVRFRSELTRVGVEKVIDAGSLCLAVKELCITVYLRRSPFVFLCRVIRIVPHCTGHI